MTHKIIHAIATLGVTIPKVRSHVNATKAGTGMAHIAKVTYLFQIHPLT